MSMPPESEDWLRPAFEVYREARIELEKWVGVRPDNTELDFYIEEMKEALLDLKEATIARDPTRVSESILEVLALLFELRFRSEDNP